MILHTFVFRQSELISRSRLSVKAIVRPKIGIPNDFRHISLMTQVHSDGRVKLAAITGFRRRAQFKEPELAKDVAGLRILTLPFAFAQRQDLI